MLTLPLALGCQRAPAGEFPLAHVGPLTAQLKSEGDALAAKGEHEGAAAKYQAALNQESTDLKLHYAFGYALSHLDRRAETVEQFRWVVQHGRPDVPEVGIARSWLINAGELTARDSSDSAPKTAAWSLFASKGTVKGKTEWKRIRPGSSYLLEVVLWPEVADGQLLMKQAELGTPYLFDNVPAGTYRLTARWGQLQFWDLKVTVAANSETVVDLTPANSLVSTEEFPPALGTPRYAGRRGGEEHHPSSRFAVSGRSGARDNHDRLNHGGEVPPSR